MFNSYWKLCGVLGLVMVGAFYYPFLLSFGSDVKSAMIQFPSVKITIIILTLLFAAAVVWNIFDYWNSQAAINAKRIALEDYTLNRLTEEACNYAKSQYLDKLRILESREEYANQREDSIKQLNHQLRNVKQTEAKAKELLSHAESQAFNIEECLRVLDDDVSEVKKLRSELEMMHGSPNDFDKERFKKVSFDLDLIDKRIIATKQAVKYIQSEERPCNKTK